MTISGVRRSIDPTLLGVDSLEDERVEGLRP